MRLHANAREFRGLFVFGDVGEADAEGEGVVDGGEEVSALVRAELGKIIADGADAFAKFVEEVEVNADAGAGVFGIVLEIADGHDEIAAAAFFEDENAGAKIVGGLGEARARLLDEDVRTGGGGDVRGGVNGEVHGLGGRQGDGLDWLRFCEALHGQAGQGENHNRSAADKYLCVATATAAGSFARSAMAAPKLHLASAGFAVAEFRHGRPFRMEHDELDGCRQAALFAARGALHDLPDLAGVVINYRIAVRAGAFVVGDKIHV